MSKFLNKIINADCLKEVKKIPDKSFDLIFADPPYNMQINDKLLRPDSTKVDGDGVMPVCCAHLEGAVQVTLPGVRHQPPGEPWYSLEQNVKFR